MRRFKMPFLLGLRQQLVRLVFIAGLSIIAMFAPCTALAATHQAGDTRLSAVAEAVGNLRRITVSENSPKVPPQAKLIIKKLKYEMNCVINSALNGEFGQWGDISSLYGLLKLKLNSHGIHIGYPSNIAVNNSREDIIEFTYGDISKIGLIRHELLGTHIIAATVAITVPCGEDTSLYLFHKKATGWVPLFIYEMLDYDTTISARNNFSYLILEKKNTSGIFVVTVDINPWCNSFWQQIRYAVHDIAEDGTVRTVLNKQETVYLGDILEKEAPYNLAATADGFTLAFRSGSFTGKVSPIVTSVFKKFVVRNSAIAEEGRDP